MRTNETRALADGEYGTIGGFIWGVARTLDYLHPYVERGAMRDDVLGGQASIDPAAERRFNDAGRDLARWRDMTIPRAAILQAEETIERWRGWSAQEAQRIQRLARVSHALGHVEMWRVDRAEVRQLRDRLLEDLRAAVAYLEPFPRPDCVDPMPVAVWVAAKRESAERRVQRAFDDLVTARRNAEATDRFVSDLRDLIGEPPIPTPPPALTALTPNGFPLDRASGHI